MLGGFFSTWTRRGERVELRLPSGDRIEVIVAEFGRGGVKLHVRAPQDVTIVPGERSRDVIAPVADPPMKFSRSR